MPATARCPAERGDGEGFRPAGGPSAAPIARRLLRYSELAVKHRIQGLASYYSSFFDGRKTANGEIFDTHELTIHGKEHKWADVSLKPGDNPLAGVKGDLFHIRAEFDLAKQVATPPAPWGATP